MQIATILSTQLLKYGYAPPDYECEQDVMKWMPFAVNEKTYHTPKTSQLDSSWD